MRRRRCRVASKLASLLPDLVLAPGSRVFQILQQAAAAAAARSAGLMGSPTGPWAAGRATATSVAPVHQPHLTT